MDCAADLSNRNLVVVIVIVVVWLLFLDSFFHAPLGSLRGCKGLEKFMEASILLARGTIL